MTDRGERGSEVADRLGRRFETDERDGPAERDEQSEPAEQELNGERDEPSERVQNVKKDWNGTYIYLPDALDGPLDNEYDRLVYECGRELDWKPKKNRHYYPVVIAAGIKAVEEMDAEAFQDYVGKLNLKSI